MRDHLNPGGTVAINVGHPPQSRPPREGALGHAAHLVRADRVLRDPVDDTNTMVLGTTSGSDPTDRLLAAPMPAEVGAVASAVAERLVPGLRGGTVYTDDRAPVEWLVDASLAQVAEENH